MPMLAYAFGPFGLPIHFALLVLVAVVLRREGYRWLAVVLLSIFTEVGIVVAAVQACVNVLDGKTWRGTAT